MEQHKILIGVPAFNEEDTITEVILKFRNYGDVFVLNDGSTDGTQQCLNEAKCMFRSLELNRGYDHALIEIFKFFEKSKYDFLITADSDGQHEKDSIIAAIEFIKSTTNLHIAVGKRNRLNRLSEHIFALVMFPALLSPDPLSGLKIYSKNFISELPNKHKELNLGTRPLFEARKKGIRIHNFSIRVSKRSDKARIGTNIMVFLKLFKIIVYYFKEILRLKFATYITKIQMF